MLIGHDHVGCAAADRDSGPEAGGILNADDIGLRGDHTFYIRAGTDIQAAAVSGAEGAALVAADADTGCGRGDPRVWMPGVDLDSGVPINIETDLLAHVAQLDVVVSCNVVGLHFHLLTIYKDGLPGGFCRDPGRDRDRAAGQRRADHHAGEHHTDILSHIFALVHLSASILTVYV